MARPYSMTLPAQHPANETASETANEIVLAHDRVVTLGPQLGHGSVASVYRAVLEGPFRVRRAVACKVYDMLPTEGRDLVATALARATRHSAHVQHPNVVAVYELTMTPDGRPVVLSELVLGRPLTALVETFVRRSGPAARCMPLDLALFVAAEIAEGLFGARDARTHDGKRLNMSHHDLSARDVLVSWRGEVKLTDFGIANAVRPASAVRAAGALARRVATMAPEVAQGGRGDARSDVFSLGVLLREMLVGPRFPAMTRDADAFAYARDGYVSMSVLEAPLPEPIASIVWRALEIDPAARYAHAGVMAYELRKACLSMGVGDGRLFLKNAMQEMLGTPKDAPNEEATARFESDEPVRDTLNDSGETEAHVVRESAE